MMATKKSAQAMPASKVEAAEVAPLTAKAMQEQSESPPVSESKIPVVLRADNTYEYHLDLAESVVNALLDPDVPDAFIEVPCTVKSMRRFLHTSYVKEIDVRR